MDIYTTIQTDLIINGTQQLLFWILWGQMVFFVGCQGKCIIFIAHLKEMILGTGSHKEAIYQSRNIFNI